MISGLAITVAIEKARARVAELAATIEALEQELRPLRQFLADRVDGGEPSAPRPPVSRLTSLSPGHPPGAD